MAQLKSPGDTLGFGDTIDTDGTYHIKEPGAVLAWFVGVGGGSATVDLQRSGTGISLTGSGTTLPAATPFGGNSDTGTLDVVVTGISGTVKLIGETFNQVIR